MIKKKNKFWTFCFSFIPGAAEMYMGFMKMGVSLLTVFLAICAITVTIEVIPLLFIAFGIWIFSFFHARNLASLTEEEMKDIEDHYMFVDEQELFINIAKKYKCWFAAFLILYGISMIWRYIINIIHSFLPEMIYYPYSDIIYRMPQLAIAIVIIFIGIRLFKGEKHVKYINEK